MSLPLLILALRVVTLPAVGQLATPAGGEVWTAGEARTLTWEPRGGTVSLEYSPDGVVVRVPVASGIADSGRFEWTVPNIPSTRARVWLQYSGVEEQEFSEAFTVLHMPTAQSAGSLYFSSSPPAREESLHVAALTPFDLYLVTDVDFGPLPYVAGLTQWEVGLQVPAELLITGVTFLTAQGIDAAGGPHDFAVTTGECLGAGAMPRALVRLECLLLEDAGDLLLTLGPSTPSSLDPADAPAWVGCGNAGGLWPYPDRGWMTLNPGDAPTGPNTWGAVKSGF